MSVKDIGRVFLSCNGQNQGDWALFQSSDARESQEDCDVSQSQGKLTSCDARESLISILWCQSKPNKAYYILWCLNPEMPGRTLILSWDARESLNYILAVMSVKAGESSMMSVNPLIQLLGEWKGRLRQCRVLHSFPPTKPLAQQALQLRTVSVSGSSIHSKLHSLVMQSINMGWW